MRRGRDGRSCTGQTRGGSGARPPPPARTAPRGGGGGARGGPPRGAAERVGMWKSRANEILRAAEIKPHLLEQWVMSELGPDFDAQAAEGGGLYLAPPEGPRVASLAEQ